VSPRRARAVSGDVADPAAALREHLLDTTGRLLAERSPNALRTREIARAADVSDGVLYNYFADKDELVVQAMVRRFAALLSDFRASLPEPGSRSVQANLEQIASAALVLHLESLPILGGLLNDPDVLRRFMREIHRDHVGAAEITGSVDRYLVAEQALGRIGDIDTRAAADLLVGSVAVRAFTTSLGVPHDHVMGGIAHVVATLQHGLEPRP
jgi:AcrR family transcriptional regulator